jgi:transglutaminase-like putative cysteine protease
MAVNVRTAVAVLFTSVVAFAAPARGAEPVAASAAHETASAAAGPSRAASAPEPEWRSLLEDTVHHVNADGTEVMTHTRRHKILKRTALSSMKETTISYSQSAQKLEVLEAYTIKAGGRRIDAPPANYQVETQSGRQSAGPAYSDRVSTTVVFPDVEVGDVVGLKYRLTTTQPLYPRKLSLAEDFSLAAAYDDVRVLIDEPVSMKSRHIVRGMTESVTTHGDRRLLSLHWSHPGPELSERTNWSVIDPEEAPGFEYSTFSSWAEVGTSYGLRAYPKATPTPRIRALAEKITAGETDPRRQARALYEWVARTITYAGNCVGIGAVVPRDLDVVIDNRQGDCKDHATLLQALLAARGIESQQALVNAGSVFKLAALPLAQQVNHVIDYVPSLDLFLDSTSDDTPFGMLPSSDQGKPVLMANGASTPTRTPAIARDADRQEVETTGEVHADGSLDATVKVALTGQPAVAMREAFRRASREESDRYVKQALKSMGFEGAGTIAYPDPQPLETTFSYEVHFHATDALNLPGSGAFWVSPWFPVPMYVAAIAHQAVDKSPAVDSTCSGGMLVEHYDLALPAGMQILAMPDGAHFASPLARYDSHYRLDEHHHLVAERRYEDFSEGPVCPADSLTAWRIAATPMWRDLRQQVLYRQQ